MEDIAKDVGMAICLIKIDVSILILIAWLMDLMAHAHELLQASVLEVSVIMINLTIGISSSADLEPQLQIAKLPQQLEEQVEGLIQMEESLLQCHMLEFRAIG